MWAICPLTDHDAAANQQRTISKTDLQLHLSIQPVHEITQLSVDHLPLDGFQPINGPIHMRVVPFAREGDLSEGWGCGGFDESGLIGDIREHPVVVWRLRRQLAEDRAVLERDR